MPKRKEQTREQWWHGLFELGDQIRHKDKVQNEALEAIASSNWDVILAHCDLYSISKNGDHSAIIERIASHALELDRQIDRQTEDA